MEPPREPELSQIFTRMAQQSKTVEDAFADLAEVTDTEAAERRDRAQAGATAAIDQLDKDITAAKTAATADWRAMQDSIDKQIKSMQADIARRQHERDVKMAERNAATAKERAAWAASYAVAASEMARLAALDAEVARREAEAIKRDSM